MKSGPEPEVYDLISSGISMAIVDIAGALQVGDFFLDSDARTSIA